MIKITCEICMDLMPLVLDGVASQDSVEAVQQHIQNCPTCKYIYEEQVPCPSSETQIVKKLQRKLNFFIGTILLFGMFFGVSLTVGEKMFFNSLIMPFIGGVGYVLFRWKSCYIVPGLLFLTHAIMQLLNLLRGIEHLHIIDILVWSSIYSIFAIIGTLIVGLIHFAFRKEEVK